MKTSRSSNASSTTTLSEPQTPNNYPCPHQHFRSTLIDRSQLNRKEHIALLATPRGYRWAEGFPPNYSGPKPFSVLKATRKTCQLNKKKLEEAEQRYIHMFVSQIFPLMSAEMVAHLKRMLVVEFGMTPKKAGEFIISQNSGSQRHKKKKAKKCCEIDMNVKGHWLKEFERLVTAKMTDYLISMLCARRSKKVVTIAKNVLNQICDITGEWCSLDDPQNKVQRIQVFVVERFAVWLANLLEKADKTICEEYSTWPSRGSEEKRRSSITSATLPEGEPTTEEEKEIKEVEHLRKEPEYQKPEEEQEPKEIEKKEQEGQESKGEEEKQKEVKELKEDILERPEQEKSKEVQEKPKEEVEESKEEIDKLKEKEEKQKMEEVQQRELEEQKVKEEAERKMKLEEQNLKEEERKKELKEQKLKEEEERKKELEEHKLKEEEKRKKELEEKTLKEEEERRKKLEEQKLREDEEKQKKDVEEQQLKEEEERKKELEEKKQKEEEERKHKLEEQKLKEEMRKKELEEQKLKDEEERKKELEEQKLKEKEERKHELEGKKEEEYEVQKGEEEDGIEGKEKDMKDVEAQEETNGKGDTDKSAAGDKAGPDVTEELKSSMPEIERISIDQKDTKRVDSGSKKLLGEATIPAEPHSHNVIEDQDKTPTPPQTKTKGAYRIRKDQKGCFFEVKKIDQKEICDRTKIARKKRIAMVPMTICARPKTSKIVRTSKDIKKWAKWANDVANFVEKWSDWIVKTTEEVEASVGDSRELKEKTEIGVLELKRNKKYIKETSKGWEKKLNKAI